MNIIQVRVWNGREMEYRIVAGIFGIFYVEGLDPQDSASLSPFNTKYPSDTPAMLNTGCLDVKGEKVWEGDLYPCIYLEDGHTDHCYEVKYDDASCAFRLVRHGNPCRQTGVYQTVADVSRYHGKIGNTYENPEFLSPNSPLSGLKAK